jgi:hypothetical protein
MQRAMAAVWTRFAWLAHPELHRLAVKEMKGNAEQYHYMRQWEDPYGQRTMPWLRPLGPGGWRDDAFHTILQWLHHKLEKRGQALQQQARTQEQQTARELGGGAAGGGGPGTGAAQATTTAVEASQSPAAVHQLLGSSPPGGVGPPSGGSGGSGAGVDGSEGDSDQGPGAAE